jgi:hypothetical protein
VTPVITEPQRKADELYKYGINDTIATSIYLKMAGMKFEFDTSLAGVFEILVL